MSQDSIVLPTTGTVSGLQMAQDQNLANATLASNFLGATPPNPTYPGQWWIDTGTTIDASGGPWLRKRNTTNTAWLRKCHADADLISELVGQAYTAFTTGGTSGAFTLTPVPAITAYSGPLRYHVKFHVGGNGSDTINISGQGTKNLKQYDSGGNKVAPVITAGFSTDIFFDGTDVVILDPLPPSGGGAAIQGAFKNLQATATGTNATVTVTVDEISLETASNAYVTRRGLVLSGALTTSGANGLDNTAPQTVVISIASPGVVTLNGHGLPANAPVVLSTTGALPTGLTAGTTYYVVNPTTNTFQLSATKGGSAINTSGTQSGTQSVASVLAASSWYSRWVIDNGTTTALLWSSSATNPVLPAGYTAKARCGWDITDGTNKYPLSFQQYGRKVQYKVAAGSNVANMPIMASGATGNMTTPTWVAVSVSSFVPPTAAGIKLSLVSGGSGSGMVAPNNSFGAYTSTSNAPPLMGYFASGNQSNLIVEFLLESTNVYYATATAAANLSCFGWEDNL